MKFNINNDVKVKLNDKGRKITNFTVKEDKDGWSKWQLWDLMSTFGKYISLGCATPFDTEIEIVEAKAAND